MTFILIPRWCPAAEAEASLLDLEDHVRLEIARNATLIIDSHYLSGTDKVYLRQNAIWTVPVS